MLIKDENNFQTFEKTAKLEIANQGFENMMHYLIDAFKYESKALIFINGQATTLYNINPSASEKKRVLIKKRQELHDLMDDLEQDSQEYNQLNQKFKTLSDQIKFFSMPEHPHTCGYVLAKGGEKYIFTLNDKTVIALLRPDTINKTKFGELEQLWRDTVRDEIKMANTLKKLDLEVQNYQEISIQYDKYSLPTLVMPSFQWLEKNGMQIRDPRNAKCYGSSMLFGSSQNISAENIKEILRIPCENIVSLLVNNILIHNDSVYIAIKDTPLTPENRPDTPAFYTELHQEVHLYFYDFTSQNSKLTTKINYENLSPTYEEIRQYADKYLFYAFYAITQGLTPHERKTIEEELSLSNKSGVNLYIESIFLEIKQELLAQIVNKVVEKTKLSQPDPVGNFAKFNIWSQEPHSLGKEIQKEMETRISQKEENIPIFNLTSS